MIYGPQQFISIDAQLTDETLGIPLDARGAQNVTFYIQANGTVSSGILTIEESSNPGRLGAWSSITTTDFGSVSVANGAEVAVHLTSAAYAFVRPRISTVIGGTGTITVRTVAQ